MALGPWTGLYMSVVEKLMLQRNEPYLLTLMAIAGHTDPFGFCFPGRKRLMRLRHCKLSTLLEREAWLQDNGYIIVVESWDYRRRQAQFDYHVSPRAMYVRSDIQDYCEAVFDAAQERDYGFEQVYLGNLFSTKDSQTEVVPESETRRSKPASKTSPTKQHHNQLRAETQKRPRVSTMRNGAKPENSGSNEQRRETPHSKDNPQAGGPDEFAALLDVDDDRLVQEIRHIASTTEHQAADAVHKYPRDLIVHWLRMTAQRRAKGTIGKPGGWFFAMLKRHNPIEVLEDGNPDSVINAHTGRGNF